MKEFAHLSDNTLDVDVIGIFSFYLLSETLFSSGSDSPLYQLFDYERKFEVWASPFNSHRKVESYNSEMYFESGQKKNV